jgi:hypothetical protein
MSYRDVEEMMRERGLEVDHSTVYRWVQCYAPEINKRIRQHLKLSGPSYRFATLPPLVGCQEEDLAFHFLGWLIPISLSRGCTWSSSLGGEPRGEPQPDFRA